MSTTQQAPGPNIDSILTEKRSFPPPPEFSKNAHIHSKEEYDKLCARAAADPEGFWADIARELHWFEPWNKVLEWDVPWAKWFWAARSISPTTASIVTCRPGGRIKRPSSGKASPERFAPYLSAVADARCASSRMC